MANLPPVLPDFEVIARSHVDLSRELGRCANLPVVQEGNMILLALRALGEQMRGVQEQMRGFQGQMRGFGEELGQIKTLITTK